MIGGFCVCAATARLLIDKPMDLGRFHDYDTHHFEPSGIKSKQIDSIVKIMKTTCLQPVCAMDVSGTPAARPLVNSGTDRVVRIHHSKR